MTEPVRLQLSRTSGFKLQELSRATNGLEAVSCCRPHTHGNPFTIAFCESWFGVPPAAARLASLRLFRKWQTGELAPGWTDKTPPPLDDIRGKNLACTCRPELPCHADVLLELANA